MNYAAMKMGARNSSVGAITYGVSCCGWSGVKCLKDEKSMLHTPNSFVVVMKLEN
jgi:hypothetical protein